MKITVLDGYTLNPGDLSWDALKLIGECDIYDRTPEDKILERIGSAEIIFTNKTPLTRDTFIKKPKIRYVGILATGYNVVDLKAAKEQGVAVTNTPAYGTAAVAQYVFALLLELCHHVGHHAQTVADGRWGAQFDFCYWDYPMIELCGKTMGIVGLGRIGLSAAKIAAAFGMKVLAYDEVRIPGVENEMLRYCELDELLNKSDVISLHCPLFESNRGMINKDSIAKMKDGVLIINTSRGPLVVEEDIAAALRSGKVGGMATDVLGVEPPKDGNVLLDAPNCIITPHIAWAAREARERLMNIAVENLKSFLNGTPVNVVNP